MTVIEGRACARFASRFAGTAQVVIGGQNRVIVKPDGTGSSALKIVSVQVISKRAFGAVSRIGGAQYALDAAGDAEVGEQCGDKLAIGAHQVTSIRV